MKNPDEDYAYGQWKQKQIDSAKVPQFAKGYGVQKYENFDPNPHIPFSSGHFEPRMTKAEAFLYAVAWGFAIGALVLTEWAK